VNSPVALALGARDLEPEKSLNMSAGVVVNPARGLTLTADVYQIDIDDRIVLTENLGAAGTGSQAVRDAVAAVLNANGFQSVGAARFFVNGLDTRTRGIDVIGTYRFATESIGKWSLTAAFNANKTRIDRRINELGPLAQIPGLVLFGRVEGLRFTHGQPRNKVVLSADGELGIFGFTARTTRYGKVLVPEAAAPVADPTSLTALGPDDQVLSPKWITDLEVRLAANETAEFAVGANNVFDVYPDRRPTGARPGGGTYPVNFNYLPYTGFSPFGFNGRFLYGRMSVRF
jgi:iron complex outermembrane receptor protein